MIDSARARTSSSVRWATRLLVFAGLFLAVGWSAFWYIAQNMAMRELHVQLDREARRGRFWSCESLESGGYPFAVVIDCRAPRLRIEDDATRTMSAKQAVVRAQLLTPTLVEIELSGPASFKSGERVSTARWSSLRVDLRGLPARLDRVSVVGNDIDAHPAELPPVAVKTLHLHFKRNAPSSMAPFALTLGAAGVDSPALAQFVGPGEPILLTLLGTVTQVDAAGVGHWSDRLEAWRAAGGRVAVTALNVSRGDVALQGDGLLGLDQLHRIDGRLALRLRNAGPAQLAIAEASVKIQSNSLSGQLAAGILGRPGELKFDLSAENGSLSVGPLRRLLLLPPLY